jgi:hypothetical protein
MARYKVIFSRRWITGRWGFTDRVLNALGGRPSEPSRTENAWLVPFKGSALALGEYLTEALKVPASRDARPGAVFEIEELDPPPPRNRPARTPRTPRVRQIAQNRAPRARQIAANRASRA